MAKAVAFTRKTIALPFESARGVIVAGCAIALIAAGPAIPFM
ncbi:hypothetical protein [Aurantiacibacter gangjinensis]|nr:hypothetical protein [Aurantiacibacter gangjinensis]APE27363.1 hypothetical protein BMF35_a0534 [Aurantiacibacter gangjinensis]